MSEKRCGTCRHYDPNEDAPGWGYCHVPVPSSVDMVYWMRPSSGTDCPCHTPRDETEEKGDG